MPLQAKRPRWGVEEKMRLSLASLSILGVASLVTLPLRAQESEPVNTPAATEATAAEPATEPTAEPCDKDTQPEHPCNGKHGDKAQPCQGCSGCKRDGHCCPHWSLGAGLSYYSSVSGSLWSSLGSSGYGSLNTTAPSYNLSAERRLDGGLWLIFTGAFQHVRGGVPVTEQSGAQATVERNMTTLSLAAGVRYVLFEDVVDLSAYAMLGGTYTHVGGHTRDSGGDLVILGAAPGSYAYAIGGTAGLTVERKLIDRLALRLSADILDAYWTAASVKAITVVGARTVSEPDGMMGGLALRPTLELRLYF